MEMESSCFICLDSKTCDWVGNYKITSADEGTCLTKHLLSIFVVRNLLQLPQQECANLLQSYVINPGEWWRVCTTCSEIIQSGYDTYKEILKLEKKLDGVRGQIRGRMKESFSAKQKQLSGKKEVERFVNVSQMIRECCRVSYVDWPDETDPSAFCEVNISPDDPPFKPHRKFNLSGVRVRKRKAKKQRQPTPLLNPTKKQKTDRIRRSCSSIKEEPISEEDSAINYDNTLDTEDNDEYLPETDDLDLVRPSKTQKKRVYVYRKRKPGLYKCNKCPFIATHRSTIHMHRKNHKLTEFLIQDDATSMSDIVECKLCHQKGRKMFMHKHVREKHSAECGLGILMCHFCNKTFCSTSALNIHIRDVHEKSKPHKCPSCEMSFSSKQIFEDHLARHMSNGENPIICEFCGLSFSTRPVLRLHMRRFHLNNDNTPKETEDSNPKMDKYRVCKYCGFKVIHRAMLNSHIKEKHPEIFRFKCDICDAIYTEAKGLKTHKLTKHSVEKAICPYCERELGCETYLRSHWKHYCKKYTGPAQEGESEEVGTDPVVVKNEVHSQTLNILDVIVFQ